MYDDDYRIDWVNVAIIIIIFGVIFVPMGYVMYAFYQYDNAPMQEAHLDIYSCDAPEGVYYADGEGCMFSYSTSLGNAYTVRYFDNGELKTLIIESDDPSLHTFLYANGTNTMHIDIHYQHKNAYGYSGQLEYFLYVPDPKTL